MLIPESLLLKEAEHVEGFAPEVAWVTQGGTEKLQERLAVRPTSETIFCTMYAKWVQTWRDLPMKYNQWCSVMRWEKATRPFLRTSEFLWQEGHTIHATAEEAQEETMQMLHVYQEVAENVMALPVYVGQKIGKGKVRRCARDVLHRSHDAGRQGAAGRHEPQLRHEFRRGVRHSVPEQGRQAGLTPRKRAGAISTRLIGAIIMTHGDERGLRAAPARCSDSGGHPADCGAQAGRDGGVREAAGDGIEGGGHSRQARRPRHVSPQATSSTTGR